MVTLMGGDAALIRPLAADPGDREFRALEAQVTVRGS